VDVVTSLQELNVDDASPRVYVEDISRSMCQFDRRSIAAVARSPTIR